MANETSNKAHELDDKLNDGGKQVVAVRAAHNAMCCAAARMAEVEQACPFMPCRHSSPCTHLSMVRMDGAARPMCFVLYMPKQVADTKAAKNHTADTVLVVEDG
jgi:hypothetical protein